MKITIKNLQQQTFSFDFDKNKTIGDLKQAIFEQRGSEYTTERQKLIYAGIILEDERTIESYNVDEKKFIVVMLKRDGGAPSKSNETSTALPSNTKSEAKTATESQNAQTKETTSAVAETNTEPSATSNSSNATVTGHLAAASNLLMGEEYERSVASIIEMGYSRDLVERAMAASFNNPERAVEYLISGIPESGELGFMQSPAGAAPSSDVVANTNSQSAVRTAASQQRTDDPFEFLRNQPQFVQMRSLVYQNPDLLQAVLRQIGNTNPALLQMISENQDAFLNMLNQPIEGEGRGASLPTSDGQESNRRAAQIEAVSRAVSSATADSAASVATSTAGRATGAVGDSVHQRRTPGGENDREPGYQTIAIHLSSHDKQAIERLKAMGFPESMVVEAYIACERDEQLAANFLISSAFDD